MLWTLSSEPQEWQRSFWLRTSDRGTILRDGDSRRRSEQIDFQWARAGSWPREHAQTSTLDTSAPRVAKCLDKLSRALALGKRAHRNQTPRACRLHSADLT